MRQAVQTNGQHTSAELLAGIDKALSDFRQNTPLADDITLVAVRHTPHVQET